MNSYKSPLIFINRFRISPIRETVQNPNPELQYKSMRPEPYICIATYQDYMLPIDNSQNAYNLLKPHFNALCEEFWLINLNSCLIAQSLKLVSKGTLNFCLVHPRDLFREALVANSFAIVIAHNHPSYDTDPTSDDLKLTKRLIKISRIIDIPILDHIIFTDLNYYSFKDNKLI